LAPLLYNAPQTGLLAELAYLEATAGNKKIAGYPHARLQSHSFPSLGSILRWETRTALWILSNKHARNRQSSLPA
jgi:hypothetical protein